MYNFNKLLKTWFIHESNRTANFTTTPYHSRNSWKPELSCANQPFSVLKVKSVFCSFLSASLQALKDKNRQLTQKQSIHNWLNDLESCYHIYTYIFSLTHQSSVKTETHRQVPGRWHFISKSKSFEIFKFIQKYEYYTVVKLSILKSLLKMSLGWKSFELLRSFRPKQNKPPLILSAISSLICQISNY